MPKSLAQIDRARTLLSYISVTDELQINKSTVTGPLYLQAELEVMWRTELFIILYAKGDFLSALLLCARAEDALQCNIMGAPLSIGLTYYHRVVY